MKRIIMVALATFTISSFTALHAQEEGEDSLPPPAPSAEAKKERPKFDANRKRPDQSEMLKKQLNLTDEQAAKVKELQAAQMEQQKKLGDSATREQRQELRKQYQEKLNAILTPEQKTELEKIHKEQGQKMREGKEKKAKERQQPQS